MFNPDKDDLKAGECCDFIQDLEFKEGTVQCKNDTDSGIGDCPEETEEEKYNRKSNHCLEFYKFNEYFFRLCNPSKNLIRLLNLKLFQSIIKLKDPSISDFEVCKLFYN